MSRGGRLSKCTDAAGTRRLEYPTRIAVLLRRIDVPGIQDYFNRKGLISDQGEKKEAFYILQKASQEGAIGKAE